jgi:hypothetical protein
MTCLFSSKKRLQLFGTDTWLILSQFYSDAPYICVSNLSEKKSLQLEVYFNGFSEFKTSVRFFIHIAIKIGFSFLEAESICIAV